MSAVWPFLLGLVPSILTGAALFYMQRAQKKRDKKEDDKISARRKETKLQLDLQMATAKLAYAVAMAYKRGKPNGEIEEGIAAYNQALDHYRDFERDQVSWLRR